ncbi:MAG: gfo/Idh/MocA family oxidoreductase [Anaerolineaceae bacterium]|jgi:predicted dehydrogenase|nr:MAG: gfo/Idh/MocA family oxidoreductase [Anaerolineaceae bacterium]
MKIYKIGLIGFGFIGKVHANAYHSIPYCYSHPSVSAQVTAVLRSHPTQDQELLAALGIPICTNDEQVFWDQDYDIIDICSPNSSHYEYALKAIERRIPIYCEKPLTKDIKDARELVKLVDQYGIPTHTALTYRFLPVTGLAKEILSAGLLGEINHFHSQFFHSSYLDPNRPISWRLQESIAGGGTLTDLGIHFLDLIQYLLGDTEWIQCQTKTFIKARPRQNSTDALENVNVDDWALCTLGMRDGGIGSLEVSRVSGGAGNTASMEIFGSHGSLKIDFTQADKIQFFDASKNYWISGGFLPENAPHPCYNQAIWPASKQSLGQFMDAHVASIFDFLSRLETKTPSPTNFHTALKSQELLHAAYQSAIEQGRKVFVNG